MFIQTAVSVFFSFCTFAFGFLRVYYFSKHLSMEEFGVLSLLLTVSAFLLYAFTLGSYQYLFKSVNDGDLARKTAFWASALVTISISSVGILVTYLFIGPIASLLNLSAYQQELKLIVLATASTAVMTIFLYYHYGLGRNNFQNFLQFLRGSLWVIVAILYSYYFNLSLTAILVTVNLCMCVIILVAVPWKELSFLFSCRIHQIGFSKLLGYCVPLFPYFAGVWGIPMIVRTQLNIHEGAKQVAVFSVAYTLMEIVFMFISTITSTLSPYFFAEQHNTSKPGLFYNIMLKYSCLSVMLIVPFIFVLRYDIITLVASEKYRIAGDYIPLLIFFPLLRVLIIVFEQFYLRAAQTVYLGIIYAVGIPLSFLLSFLLIPLYSVFGAIYASLASYLFLFACLYFRQRRILDIAYLKVPAMLLLGGIICLTVFALGLIDVLSFYKVIPLGIVMVLSVAFLPVLSGEEKIKILSLLKIRKK